MINLFHPFIADEAKDEVAKVLDSRFVGQGPISVKLEKEFAEKFNYRHPVLLSSGTAGLHLALMLAGVTPGSETITTAQTCTATTHPILQCGSKPVWGDIKYETGNLDAGDIEHRITDKTKAIMVVHWAGYPCDMEEIKMIGKKHNLPVIQDGAHAIGATYQGRPLDQWSDYLMHSFQAIKTITTIDGGILLTSTEKKRQEAIRRRWFGIDRDNRTPSDDGYWTHELTEVGYKYQPNDVLSAIGLANLQYFDWLFARRQQICQMYRVGLRDVPGVTLLENKSDRVSGCWLFTMHVENRDDFFRKMTIRGIETSVVHRRNDIYDIFGGRVYDLPNVDKWEKTNISIPLHNKLTNADVEYVIESIKGGW